MLGIRDRHALPGDAIFFDPKGDRAAPGEITNGFADLQLRDVDMRDENQPSSPGLHLKVFVRTPRRLASHKKAAMSISAPQQRGGRKPFSLLVNTPAGDRACAGSVGEEDALAKKSLGGGFAQSNQGVRGGTPRRENRRSNNPALCPAAAAAHEGEAKALTEDHDDDKENRAPPKPLPGVDPKDDRGRDDGELFEQPETTIRNLREQVEKEREAAGVDGELVRPLPLDVAKSKAAPGTRFRQGPLGELSVVDLYSTGERVSVPSKGISQADGKPGGVSHLMTEQGRAGLKAYLSALPPIFHDPDSRVGQKDVMEDELVDMFLSLHFGDGWLDGDTVITRAPQQAQAGPPTSLEDPAKGTGCSRIERSAKRYRARSSDDFKDCPEAGAAAAAAAVVPRGVERALRPTMGPPPVPIRRDGPAAARGSRPIPIHKAAGGGGGSFRNCRDPPPEGRSFVFSASDGDDEACGRSFASVSTQTGTYGTPCRDRPGLDGPHIGRCGRGWPAFDGPRDDDDKEN